MGKKKGTGSDQELLGKDFIIEDRGSHAIKRMKPGQTVKEWKPLKKAIDSSGQKLLPPKRS